MGAVVAAAAAGAIAAARNCCWHCAQVAVRVGRYQVFPGCVSDMDASHLNAGMVLIMLTEESSSELQSFRGPVIRWKACREEGWERFLRSRVIPALEVGDQVVPIDMFGHDMNPYLVGSLIALLEAEQQTPDPIEAVRQRYCRGSVIPPEQWMAERIFALRKQELPQRYIDHYAEQKRQERLAEISCLVSLLVVGGLLVGLLIAALLA